MPKTAHCINTRETEQWKATSYKTYISGLGAKAVTSKSLLVHLVPSTSTLPYSIIVLTSFRSGTSTLYAF